MKYRIQLSIDAFNGANFIERIKTEEASEHEHLADARKAHEDYMTAIVDRLANSTLTDFVSGLNEWDEEEFINEFEAMVETAGAKKGGMVEALYNKIQKETKRNG